MDAQNAEALQSQGNLLLRQGRPQEAEACYKKALDLSPKNVEALANRGVALLALKQWDGAAKCLSRASELKPDNPEIWFNLAAALSSSRMQDKALLCLDKAIGMKPDFIQALNNRGLLLKTLGRYDEALASFGQILALQPNSVEALNNLATIWLDLDDPDRALANSERALEIEPDHIEALINRGVALGALKRPAEAAASFDKALAIDGENVEARWNRGLNALFMGNYAEGWSDYEYRRARFSNSEPEFLARYPNWRGEPLLGRRILVYEEQGLGDTIQFARFLPELAACGAQVIFLVQRKLHRLLHAVDSRIRLADCLKQGETFDFKISLASLPHALRTTVEGLPGDVPYMFPEAELIAKWRKAIGDHGFKVGICWQGNPETTIDIGRSVPVEYFYSLAQIPGVRLISIQKEHGLDQLAACPQDIALDNLGARLDSGSDAFVDTAAAMFCVDLIITSDTSIAHLAGALGRPAWIALKHAADWRWLANRSDSPWYPSLKLYRQTSRGDWKSAFDEISADLARLVQYSETSGANAPLMDPQAMKGQRQ